MKNVHKAAVLISWGLLAAAMIHLCFKWEGMPEITGVHFGNEGEFDVFASKKYITYPFVIAGVVLILLHLAAFAARRVKLGVKINSEGETKLRERIMLLIDANRLFVSAWAVYWVELVIYQHKLNGIPITIGMLLLFVLFIDTCRTIPKLKQKYPLEELRK